VKNKLTNEQMMRYLSSLSDPDLLETCSIDSPLGSNQYYSARTVIDLLIDCADRARAYEKERCAKSCEKLAEEYRGRFAEDDSLYIAANECAVVIRSQ